MNSTSATPVEACDLCGTSLTEPHLHLLESATRKIECVCQACAILFNTEQQKYRRVPTRVAFLPDFQMTEAQWDALAIPIGVAFFARSSTANRITALYPSPAGPVESLLPLETWAEIERDNSCLATMESDVEGLLVYRGSAGREYYIIPIDEFFKLTGLIRLKWRGFSGGLEIWRDIAQFLEKLKQRSSKERL
jgi:Family of unknown function (DUF5947)